MRRWRRGRISRIWRAARTRGRHVDAADRETMGEAAPPLTSKSPLDAMKMCATCQAHGIVKVQYGYRVMDQVCETCKGEGVLVNGKPIEHAGVDADSDPGNRRRRLERLIELIERCDDLDELERLEARVAELKEDLGGQ